jgi:Ca2+-binding EF-hand superfamily protein
MRKTLVKSQEYLNIPQPTFTRDELNDLKNFMKIFDHKKDNTVMPRDLVEGLKLYEINKTSPQLFDIINRLNNPSNNTDGMTYQEIIDELQQEFGKKMDRKEVRRIFDLFLKDKTQDSLYLADFKNTCANLNLDYSNHDILMMLKDASALKNELTFDEFYTMMTENLIHIN